MDRLYRRADVLGIVVGALNGHREVLPGRARSFERVLEGAAAVHPALEHPIAHPWQGQLHDDVRHTHGGAECGHEIGRAGWVLVHRGSAPGLWHVVTRVIRS